MGLEDNQEDFNISKFAMNLSKPINGKINSVSRFVEKLKELENHLEANGIDIRNYELIFRGHGSRRWISLPSIYRDGLIEKEHTIFRELITIIPEDFAALSSTFQKLVKMQHYGLPTRLLDVTGNALVALYFACESVKDNKGNELSRDFND